VSAWAGAARPSIILLVEDEASNRLLVRAIVAKAESRGISRFEIIEAGSLDDARRALAARHVDLVLRDVQLPDGVGLDLLNDVGGRPVSARPKVVVMSASVHETNLSAAFEAGADGFVGKPFPGNQLIRLLERVETNRALEESSIGSAIPA